MYLYLICMLAEYLHLYFKYFKYFIQHCHLCYMQVHVQAPMQWPMTAQTGRIWVQTRPTRISWLPTVRQPASCK